MVLISKIICLCATSRSCLDLIGARTSNAQISVMLCNLLDFYYKDISLMCFWNLSLLVFSPAAIVLFGD